MKLVDLDPRFHNAGGPGVFTHGPEGLIPAPERSGVGISFNCPCGCDRRCFVPFKNPLDGGPDYGLRPDGGWQRAGNTFDTLTLTPSVQRLDGCRWHGWITNGEARSC